MLKNVLYLVLVFTFSHGINKEFRFDYQYSKKANGWLKLHNVPVTWQEARQRCHAEGGVLASPLTTDLHSAILEHVVREKGAAPYTIFIGVHSIFSKGDYTSIEGSPLLKMPIKWAPGEPDNYNNSEGCLVMLTQGNGGGAVGDVMCSNVFPYVCYKKKTAIALSACGTLDKGYNLDDRTGSCYKFHRRGLQWSRAFMTCAAEGAYLAIINSEEESQVLRELFSKNPDTLIFATSPGIASIGFHDWGERNSWMTIHGETLEQAGFARFQDKQPDNKTNPRTGDVGEFCGSIFRNGDLNDVCCNIIVPFICEKNPNSLYGDIED